MPAWMRPKSGLPCRVGTMETLGGLVGANDEDFHKWLTDYVEGIKPYFESLLHPDLPVQIANQMLRLSDVPKVGFLSRIVPPMLIEPHAVRFDEMVVDTLSPESAHSQIPSRMRQSAYLHCPFVLVVWVLGLPLH